MANHLLTQTVPQQMADLARYYTRGMAPPQRPDGTPEPIAAQPRPDMHPLVAEGLGIDPDRPLAREELNALLAGRRADGEKIEGKRYAKLRTTTNPKTRETKELIPIGSVDFCLSPDKSVSIAWAFGTGAEQASIYQAHRDASEEAMRHVEREIGRARKGEGGKDGSDAGHIGWVAFDHYTSRPTLWIARDENGKRITEAVPIQIAGDPELHTHFTVMNSVFCENGRVGSLDLDRLDGLIKEGGALYQAHLATNLRKIGADVILDQETRSARLTAIPDHVREHFSKKTRNGEEAARDYARRQGLDWETLSESRRVGLLKAGTQGMSMAGLDDKTTRRLKKDDMADFAEWQRQAKELGWNHISILPYGPSAPPVEREDRIAYAYEQAMPFVEKALHQRSVITGPDIRTAAARGLIAAGIEDHRDISRVTALFREQGVRQNGEPTALVWGQEEDRKHVSITTALHIDQEREFIGKAKVAAGDRSDAMSKDQVDRAVAASGLSFESTHGEAQLAAIHRLGEGGRLGVVIGAAGAGKTTLLQPLVTAWQEQGRDVHGIALAWRQADDLTDAGISPKNVKAFSVFMEAAASEQIALSPRSVLIVDELSLLGTRQGLELLRLQARHGFRVAMLGDDRQNQSIEAGAIIGLSRKALGGEQVPEILSTLRQQTVRERSIAGAFRDGQAATALEMKRADKTVELVPGGYREALERTAAMVIERKQANAGNPQYSLTISAPTNMDAHRIGVVIRQKRQELGLVAADTVKVKAIDRDGNAYDMALAAGDRVRLFASTRVEGQPGSIGRNGSVLTLLDATEKGIRVQSAKGREGFIPWKTLADTAGRVRLAYGDVLTTHSAQGLTSTEHIYALPGGSKAVNGFSAYASGTRHRRASFMILSAGAEQADVARHRPLNDVRPIAEQDVWDNVVRNLGRQPKKQAALDFLQTATAVKHGAVRALQRAHRPAEMREKMGQPPTTLHHTLHKRHEAEIVRPMVERMEQQVSRHRAVVDRLAKVGPAVAQAVKNRIEQIRHHHHQPPDRSRGPGHSL